VGVRSTSARGAKVFSTPEEGRGRVVLEGKISLSSSASTVVRNIPFVMSADGSRVVEAKFIIAPFTAHGVCMLSCLRK
jgi:hypothetical protein